MIDQKFVNQYAIGSQVDLLTAERDVVLTYALRILSDASLPGHLVFKGGTCLRKIYLGRTGRFSEDLDFTGLDATHPDDLILALAALLDGKSFYDIAFSVPAQDLYVREDEKACGVLVEYSHEWNPKAQFEVQISFREEPILPTEPRPLITEGYFKRLEIEPPLVRTLHFEEVVAEKIRAFYQRGTTRDMYDLFLLGQRPFDRDRVRALSVVKCWLVNDSFDPNQLFERIQTESFDWADLARLVPKRQLPEKETIIATCQRNYRFLNALSPNELLFAQDKHRRRNDLFEVIVENVRQL